MGARKISPALHSLRILRKSQEIRSRILNGTIHKSPILNKSPEQISSTRTRPLRLLANLSSSLACESNDSARSSAVASLLRAQLTELRLPSTQWCQFCARSSPAAPASFNGRAPDRPQPSLSSGCPQTAALAGIMILFFSRFKPLCSMFGTPVGCPTQQHRVQLRLPPC